MDIKKLIEEVIYDLANDATMSSITSKVQVISRLLKNTTFTKWVNEEFVSGYTSRDDIPNCRKVIIVDVKGSYLTPTGFGSAIKYTNVVIPIGNLSNEDYTKMRTLYILEPISSIEDWIKQNSDIHYSLTHGESCQIQKILQDSQILRVYKVASRQCMRKIVNNAKTKLLDIFLDFNESLFENDIDFNAMNKKTEISQIVNQTINAGVYVDKGASANISNPTFLKGNNNNIQINAENTDKIRDIISEIKALSKDIDADREDMAFAILEINTKLNEAKNPKAIKLAFNSLKGILSSATKSAILDKINALIAKGIELVTQ